MECHIQSCKKRAKFNVIGSENPRACEQHKDKDMIQIRQQRCRYCGKAAVFGYTSGKSLACKKHMKSDMVDVKNKKCLEKNCNTQPRYNFEGEKRGIYCVEHQKAGMEDVLSKKCKHKKCKISPCYNFKGQTSGLYCLTHKKPEMVDVVHKKCEANGCTTRPTYNYEGQKTAIYCEKHMKEGMVDVHNKKCLHHCCNTRPVYNSIGESMGLYCSEHKLDGMVDVLSTKCLHEGCDTQPNFNFEGQKNGIYCSEHKEPTMVDVKNKKCLHDGCETQPNFNFEGAVNGIYCSEHKEPTMVDIKNKKCQTPLCDTQSTTKYEGYCFRCFIYMFPDSQISRNYKTKERYITKKIQEWITKNYPELKISFDKQISGGCSLRRPDMFIELLTHVVIIEVDENQHKQTPCENLRMVQLFEDVAQRPCVFIRFNPDSYLSANGKRVKGCFKYTKKGLCIIDSEKCLMERLEPVFHSLKTYLSEPQEKMIQVDQHWYNQIEIEE